MNTLLLELIAVISLVVQSNHCSNSNLFENRHIILGSKGDILGNDRVTSSSSMGSSVGELNAKNSPGIIQFKFPFSIFS